MSLLGGGLMDMPSLTSDALGSHLVFVVFIIVTGENS